MILFVSLPRLWPDRPPEVELPVGWAEYARAQRAAVASVEPETFYFDPNTVSKEELQRLGLSATVAGSWLRYRGNRRNAFRRPEDIRRLYRLDSVDAERLLPWVKIGSSTNEVASSSSAAAATPQPSKTHPASFPFDPNSVSADELRQLGLSAKQATAFLRYRSKSSPFRSAEDLRRLRILTPKNLDHLLPLVDIPPPVRAEATTSPTDAEQPKTYGNSLATPQPYRPADRIVNRIVDRVVEAIDVNTATIEDWKSLPGIGTYRAGKIIRFREVLGGFASVTQIGTTRGLPDSTFRDIEAFLRLDTPPRRSLAVNHDPATSLVKHPYLNRAQAKAIVSYRQQHGPFNTPEDLLPIRLIDAEDLERLRPYLDLGE